MTLFVHGWGFSSEVWPTKRGVFYDRGYFFHPRPFPQQSVHTLVTHSFGLHFVPPTLLAGIKKLIVLGGFVDFKRKNRVIERMLQGDLKVVLRDFYLNCGYNGTVHLFNHTLLTEDLETLRTSTFRPIEVEEVVVIHGKEDKIVPWQWGRALYETFGRGSWQLIEGDHTSIIKTAYQRGFF